jgi:LmbE family N-acetylglucosaminyl deacetylase
VLAHELVTGAALQDLLDLRQLVSGSDDEHGGIPSRALVGGEGQAQLERAVGLGALAEEGELVLVGALRTGDLPGPRLLGSRRLGRLTGESIVVISTHLDDAVLSCWSLLDSDDDVTVVTVFTGGPAPGFVSSWDADTGVDSATRMEQRRAENRAALAVAERTPVDLGLLEVLYGGGVVTVDAIRAHVDRADLVYAPAGIGLEHANKEHGIVRDAVLTARPDARLYADQPYCQFRPDSQLPAPLADGRRPTPVVLSREQRLRKIDALRCYAGELPKLERAFTPFLSESRLAYELFWT